MLRAGARAVLPRSAGPEEIRAAVRAAAAGLASLPAALAGALLEGTPPDGGGAPVDTGDPVLTPRERQGPTPPAAGAPEKGKNRGARRPRAPPQNPTRRPPPNTPHHD